MKKPTTNNSSYLKTNDISSESEKKHPNINPGRFGPVDLELVMLLGRLSPGRRVRTMLEAQAFLMSAIRGRIRRQFPNLSQREINLKVLEEIARYG